MPIGLGSLFVQPLVLQSHLVEGSGKMDAGVKPHEDTRRNRTRGEGRGAGDQHHRTRSRGAGRTLRSDRETLWARGGEKARRTLPARAPGLSGTQEWLANGRGT